MNSTICLEQIDDFMVHHFGGDAILKLGVWDESDNTRYAILEQANPSGFGRMVIAGESTYGSESFEEALKGLCVEIAKYEIAVKGD